MLLLSAWGATLLGRKLNSADARAGVAACLGAGAALASLGAAALLYAPWVTGLDPTRHVYPATVWLL